MKKKYFLHQLIFVLRFRYLNKWRSLINTIWLKISGMQIGEGTYLSKIKVTWPHQISIGKNCVVEHSVYFKFDGIWKEGPSIIIEDDVFVGFGCEFNIKKKVVIGKDSLIGSGCKFVDHDHGISLEDLMRNQIGPEAEIVLEENVWLGTNVVVLKGVTIGNGAIIAAGSIVNKSIPPNEIWAGIPAKKIRDRK